MVIGVAVSQMSVCFQVYGEILKYFSGCGSVACAQVLFYPAHR